MRPQISIEGANIYFTMLNIKSFTVQLHCLTFLLCEDFIFSHSYPFMHKNVSDDFYLLKYSSFYLRSLKFTFKKSYLMKT